MATRRATRDPRVDVGFAMGLPEGEEFGYVAPPMPKVVVKQPSMFTIYPKVNKYVPSHARLLANIDDLVRLALKMLIDEGWGKGDDRLALFPHNIDWEDPAFRKILATFERILHSNFRPITLEGVTSATMKALEMPMRVSTHQCLHLYDDPDAHIVVLDVWKGKEVVFMHNAFDQRPLRCNVHLVFSGSAPIEGDRLMWWHERVETNKLFLHSEDWLPRSMADGTPVLADRVFCSFRIGYWLRSVASARVLFDWLSRHLRRPCPAYPEGGEVICSYVNPLAVRHLEIKARGQETGLAVLEETEPNEFYHFGSTTIRVRDREYEDGRIPYDLVHELSRSHGLTVGTPSLKYMEAYGSWQVPHSMTNVARCAEVSCVNLLYLRSDLVPTPPQWMGPRGRTKRWHIHDDAVGTLEGFSSEALDPAAYNFPLNHGKALAPDDVYFFHPQDQWIALKRDGISGRLVIRDGFARLYVRHMLGDLLYVFPVDSVEQGMYQVEAVYPERRPIGSHGRGRARGDAKVLPAVVWLLDVYDSPGVHESDDFESRWDLGTSFLSSLKLPLLQFQNWVPYTTEAFVTLASQCGKNQEEGVVFQNRHAPRGHFQNQLGSARYWKPRDRITVDKLYEGSVYRFTLDGTMLDKRFDKDKPNSPDQIAQLEASLGQDDIIALLDTSPVPSSVANEIVESIRSDSMDLSPDALVTLLHPNKNMSTVHLALVTAGLSPSLLEASHLLARYLGVVDEILSSNPDIGMLPRWTGLKWYEPRPLPAQTHTTKDWAAEEVPDCPRRVTRHRPP